MSILTSPLVFVFFAVTSAANFVNTSSILAQKLNHPRNPRREPSKDIGPGVKFKLKNLAGAIDNKFFARGAQGSNEDSIAAVVSAVHQAVADISNGTAPPTRVFRPAGIAA